MTIRTTLSSVKKSFSLAFRKASNGSGKFGSGFKSNGCFAASDNLPVSISPVKNAGSSNTTTNTTKTNSTNNTNNTTHNTHNTDTTATTETVEELQHVEEQQEQHREQPPVRISVNIPQAQTSTPPGDNQNKKAAPLPPRFFKWSETHLLRSLDKQSSYSGTASQNWPKMLDPERKVTDSPHHVIRKLNLK